MVLQTKQLATMFLHGNTYVSMIQFFTHSAMLMPLANPSGHSGHAPDARY